jgi:hypothetical protein
MAYDIEVNLTCRCGRSDKVMALARNAYHAPDVSAGLLMLMDAAGWARDVERWLCQDCVYDRRQREQKQDIEPA